MGIKTMIKITSRLLFFLVLGVSSALITGGFLAFIIDLVYILFSVTTKPFAYALLWGSLVSIVVGISGVGATIAIGIYNINKSIGGGK